MNYDENINRILVSDRHHQNLLSVTFARRFFLNTGTKYALYLRSSMLKIKCIVSGRQRIRL